MISKKILFISKGTHSPSTRYRALNYFDLFKKQGWQVQHITHKSTLLLSIKVLFFAAQSDIVVVLRKTFSAFYLRLLRKVSKKLIFDFDDAIFCRNDGTPSSHREKKFLRMLATCDTVWAGNHYLASKAQMHCANTQVIPTSITQEKYQISTIQSSQYFDLVWIGSSSTKKYLMDLLPTLEIISEKIRPLRLKIIADFTLSSQKLAILPLAWNNETEVQDIATAHVGIAPMSDDAWTRGKCALKVIQYMAAGLPVVSSDVGANAEVIINGETGFLARNPQEWLTAIENLFRDSSLRTAMGTAGKFRALEHYSLEASFKKMSKCVMN